MLLLQVLYVVWALPQEETPVNPEVNAAMSALQWEGTQNNLEFIQQGEGRICSQDGENRVYSVELSGRKEDCG